ncbi:MAG: hypothetical protein GYA55_10475 [SAR324 cluster bacterium]|uniref:Uncharacterized protein n=1 Tax=SAR324 cluster bacterium TaxID=2024889 RepID=A0A7X9FSM4_9DELT|nr:hypothetical protein [SAR324 cluster bacterium]
MSIILFAPFSSSSAEAGLMYLVGNYLRYLRQDVFQLRCNGIFPVCERDSEHEWKRNIRSCPACIAEQRMLARWGSLESKDLSSFLQPDEIQDTWRTILNVPKEELMEFRYRGVPLFELARGSFRDYFGVDHPVLKSEEQIKDLRQLLLSTWRMAIAVRRLNNRMTPRTALVTGGQDYMSRTYVAHSVGQGIDVVVFQWSASDRAVNLINLRDNRCYSCEFIIEDLRMMRNNPESWSDEPLEQIHSILDFIGIPAKLNLIKAAQ